MVYCQGGSGSGSSCHEVATGYRFPNGLHRARDGLLYVPSSGDMDITAYREVIAPGEAATRTLEKVGHLDMDGYSVDNLAEDANGDLWLATFPKPLDAMAIASDPFNFWPRSTVFRIRKSIVGGKVTMTADKIIEDRDKVVLPGTTTVVHDAKTGRLFLSGMYTGFSWGIESPPSSVDGICRMRRTNGLSRPADSISITGIATPFITVCDPR